MAAQKGLSTIWYPKRIDRLLAKDKRAKIFYDKHKNELDASISLGMLALSTPTGNYWYDFGYTCGGPTILGFMKWLDKQAQKDGRKEILFVARDGYTPEKVFNIIKTDEDIRTHYVYAPRKWCEKIFSSDGEVIQNYTRYLGQLGLRDEKLMFVDSGSALLTSQRAITTVLPEKEVKGYYWNFNKDNFEKRFGSLKYHVKTWDERGWNWRFIELLMTAPTPPISAVDENGEPVFQKPTKDELKRIEIYPDISNGALEFARICVDIFGKTDVCFSSEILRDWMNIFCNVPTKIDKQYFSDIKHANSRNYHSNYLRLMEHWYK